MDRCDFCDNLEREYARNHPICENFDMGVPRNNVTEH